MNKGAAKGQKLALVALGPSSFQYFAAVENAGDRSVLFDQVWTCNTFASLIKSDLLFHMDDIRVQMARAEKNEKIRNLVEVLRNYQGRVITSRTHPEFPCLEAYPLEAIMNEFQVVYFNNTLAYAMAYAIWLEFDTIALYGCDYHYQGSHEFEAGRACLEYWIGRAWERGIKIVIASSSTLLDANCQHLYGYDTLDVAYRCLKDGTVQVKMEEKKDLVLDPDQIEERYAHRPKQVQKQEAKRKERAA